MRYIKMMIGAGILLLLFYSMIFITQCRIIIDVTSVQQTLNEQREIAYEIELTAVTDRVIDINKELDLWQKISEVFPILFIDKFKNLDRIM